MSMKNYKSNAGNGLLAGLAIVAVIGAAVIGFYLYSQKTPMSALPEAHDIVAESVEDPASGHDRAADTVAGHVEDMQEAGASGLSGTASAPVAEAVAIDVEKVFAPRAIGQPDAPVKIIEYASMTCNHCAHFHNDVLPDLKSKYIDTGKVYFEFREFPLNDPALKASLTARCLPEDKYEGFVSLLFKTQDHWAGGLDYMAALRQNAKLAGMSDATFDACHAENQLKTRMAEEMQAAQDRWNISATPTFIINDGAEIVSGARPLSEFERVFRKVSGDAVGQVPAVE